MALVNGQAFPGFVECDDKRLEHHTLIASHQQMKDKYYHVQYVNSIDNLYEKWVKQYNGVSTKYLSQYLNWFVFLEKVKKSSTQTLDLAKNVTANVTAIKTYRSICEFSYTAKGWSKPRMLKAMRSEKEYVQVSYLGQKQIVPVYQYVCYASSYDMIATELHELYKQHSTSETWIEQVKGHTMAGNTLTDDFWANDILWQLSVLAYNIPASWRVRQKKNKFKQQEHRSFIDWFIAVPAKITISGHQIELKMYEHHFYKDAWEELDRLIEAA